MLTLILVVLGALVIMAIAAAVNRRPESLPDGARTSKTRRLEHTVRRS